MDLPQQAAVARSISDWARAYEPVALLILHLALSGAVTVHLLRSRRVNRSAAAWVGLVWLAPFIGTALYLLLGVNRVRRRAATLRGVGGAGPRPAFAGGLKRDDHLSALSLAGDRITQRAALEGNAITVLHSGDESYPPMLAAIAAAKASLSLSVYLFRADAIGRQFIEALTAAARRGVSVCVIVDGIGSGYFHSAVFRRLRHNDVPVARFLHSPLPWRMPFINLRTHKKLLIADGRLAFTGGLNIGAENLIADHPRHAVLDTHFQVEGPIVAHLARTFADDWYFCTGKELSGNAWYPPLAPAGSSTARVVTSGPDQDLEKIEFLMLEAIGCARLSIRIMTPYFAPDDRLITALCLAALRGVNVELILPTHSNHEYMDGAARAAMGPLLETGCKVWAHHLPFDHSKLMTVDGLWSLLGSANWDIRSLRLNFELDLEVCCPIMARALNEHMDGLQLEAITAQTLAQRSLSRVLRDGVAMLLMPYL
jgi:cardiolipin synthase